MDNDSKTDDVLTDRRAPRTAFEIMTFKLDRTLAIVGVILLGAWALTVSTPEAIQITTAAIGGLVGYVGGRTGK